MLLTGGGVMQPPQPLPWIRLCHMKCLIAKHSFVLFQLYRVFQSNNIETSDQKNIEI